MRGWVSQQSFGLGYVLRFWWKRGPGIKVRRWFSKPA